MKKATYIPLFLLLLKTQIAGAQQPVPTGAWKIYSYNGELRLNGISRVMEQNNIFFKERQQMRSVIAALSLQTRNYIWHPRFLTLDIDGEYSPSREDEKYLVLPERAENRDLRKFDLRLNLLPQNKFSVSSYFNFRDLYNNRENLSSLKMKGTNLGTTLYYRTKRFPFSVGYSSCNQDEKEVLTGRNFRNRQQSLEGQFNPVLGKRDKHEIRLSHNIYYRKDFNNYEVSNHINNLNYNNRVPLGSRERSISSTLVSAVFQNGNEDFQRYQVMENITSRLADELQLSMNYNLFYEKRPFARLTQHRPGLSLSHKLFESLSTRLSYDLNQNNNTFYHDRLHQARVEINYTKKIDKKHLLELGYTYNLQAQKWKSGDALINIFNESVTLKDGSIALLSKPFVTPGSIQVKDGTGTTFFQLNTDYLLVQRNDFIEVQRVPGGQIPNNSTVYVDYEALQPGNYHYTSIFRQFSAAFYFFDHLIGIYGRFGRQGYDHLKKTDFITLNYFTRNVAGFRFDKKFMNAGVEYDEMNSTVLPYRLFWYYLNLQGSAGKKLLVSLNGSFYDYKRLNDIRNVKYADLSSSVSYQLSPRTSVMASGFYRQQKGQGINLDLFSYSGEFKTSFRKIFFSLMYNSYDRKIFTDKLHFNSLNVQLSRKF